MTSDYYCHNKNNACSKSDIKHESSRKEAFYDFAVNINRLSAAPRAWAINATRLPRMPSIAKLGNTQVVSQNELVYSLVYINQINKSLVNKADCKRIKKLLSHCIAQPSFQPT
jgi:hypothetical protein